VPEHGAQERRPERRHHDDRDDVGDADEPLRRRLVGERHGAPVHVVQRGRLRGDERGGRQREDARHRRVEQDEAQQQ
jgi:hypothetical protein